MHFIVISVIITKPHYLPNAATGLAKTFDMHGEKGANMNRNELEASFHLRRTRLFSLLARARGLQFRKGVFSMPGRPQSTARKATKLEEAVLAVFRELDAATPSIHKETEPRHGVIACQRCSAFGLPEVQRTMRQFMGKSLCPLSRRRRIVDDDGSALIRRIAESAAFERFELQRDSALASDALQAIQECACVGIDNGTIHVGQFLPIGLRYVENMNGLEEYPIDRFGLARFGLCFAMERARREDHDSALAWPWLFPLGFRCLSAQEKICFAW